MSEDGSNSKVGVVRLLWIGRVDGMEFFDGMAFLGAKRWVCMWAAVDRSTCVRIKLMCG